MKVLEQSAVRTADIEQAPDSRQVDPVEQICSRITERGPLPFVSKNIGSALRL